MKEYQINSSISNNDKNNKKEDLSDVKSQTIGQIKNIFQEKKEDIKSTTKAQFKLEIKTFTDLIELCNIKKEIKLKYELETNVNLVNFEDNRIEISFNENLDKEFIKNLSAKLYDWTSERWIISLSKENGAVSIKEKTFILKEEMIKDAKNTLAYKNIIEAFPDAELIDIDSMKDKNNE